MASRLFRHFLLLILLLKRTSTDLTCVQIDTQLVCHDDDEQDDAELQRLSEDWNTKGMRSGETDDSAEGSGTADSMEENGLENSMENGLEDSMEENDLEDNMEANDLEVSMEGNGLENSMEENGPEDSMEGNGLEDRRMDGSYMKDRGTYGSKIADSTMEEDDWDLEESDETILSLIAELKKLASKKTEEELENVRELLLLMAEIEFLQQDAGKWRVTEDVPKLRQFNQWGSSVLKSDRIVAKNTSSGQETLNANAYMKEGEIIGEIPLQALLTADVSTKQKVCLDIPKRTFNTGLTITSIIPKTGTAVAISMKLLGDVLRPTSKLRPFTNTLQRNLFTCSSLKPIDVDLLERSYLRHETAMCIKKTAFLYAALYERFAEQRSCPLSFGFDLEDLTLEAFKWAFGAVNYYGIPLRAPDARTVYALVPLLHFAKVTNGKHIRVQCKDSQCSTTKVRLVSSVKKGESLVLPVLQLADLEFSTAFVNFGITELQKVHVRYRFTNKQADQIASVFSPEAVKALSESVFVDIERNKDGKTFKGSTIYLLERWNTVVGALSAQYPNAGVTSSINSLKAKVGLLEDQNFQKINDQKAWKHVVKMLESQANHSSNMMQELDESGEDRYTPQLLEAVKNELGFMESLQQYVFK